jgi:hypothetical protein
MGGRESSGAEQAGDGRGGSSIARAVCSAFPRSMHVAWQYGRMCRSIKPLFNFDPPVTEEEVRAASLQFVRKISGFHKPSKTNEEVFLGAVNDISVVAARLLHTLDTSAAPRNRLEEAAKAKARSKERFGATR